MKNSTEIVCGAVLALFFGSNGDAMESGASSGFSGAASQAGVHPGARAYAVTLDTPEIKDFFDHVDLYSAGNKEYEDAKTRLADFLTRVAGKMVIDPAVARKTRGIGYNSSPLLQFICREGLDSRLAEELFAKGAETSGLWNALCQSHLMGHPYGGLETYRRNLLNIARLLLMHGVEPDEGALFHVVGTDNTYEFRELVFDHVSAEGRQRVIDQVLASEDDVRRGLHYLLSKELRPSDEALQEFRRRLNMNPNEQHKAVVLRGFGLL